MDHANTSDLLTQLASSRAIRYIPALAWIRIGGKPAGARVALFLSQLIYWTSRREDQAVRKTARSWTEETGLTDDELQYVRRRLREAGLLIESRRGRKDGTIRYELNRQALSAAIQDLRNSGFLNFRNPEFRELGFPKFGKPDSRNSAIPLSPLSLKNIKKNIRNTSGLPAAEAGSPEACAAVARASQPLPLFEPEGAAPDEAGGCVLTESASIVQSLVEARGCPFDAQASVAGQAADRGAAPEQARGDALDEQAAAAPQALTGSGEAPLRARGYPLDAQALIAVSAAEAGGEALEEARGCPLDAQASVEGPTAVEPVARKGQPSSPGSAPPPSPAASSSRGRKRRATEPDSRIPGLLAWMYQVTAERNGGAGVPRAYGRDAKILKNLLAQYPIEQLRRSWERYVSRTDPQWWSIPHWSQRVHAFVHDNTGGANGTRRTPHIHLHAAGTGIVPDGYRRRLDLGALVPGAPSPA